VLQVIKDIGRFEICKYHKHVRIRRDLSHMVCQCSGTWKGIKSKARGELDISLQALFTYLCVLCACDCAISPLILLFFNTSIIMGFNGNWSAYKYQFMTKYKYTYVVPIFNNYFGYYFPLMPKDHVVYWIFDLNFFHDIL
jgi:hypothetical protein